MTFQEVLTKELEKTNLTDIKSLSQNEENKEGINTYLLGKLNTGFIPFNRSFRK